MLSRAARTRFWPKRSMTPKGSDQISQVEEDVFNCNQPPKLTQQSQNHCNMDPPKKVEILSKVPNKQVHARISFLYQAANYFSNLQDSSSKTSPKSTTKDVITTKQTDESISSLEEKNTRNSVPNHGNITNQIALSTYFSSHISTISLKAQARLSPTIKRSICKRCKAILVPGKTCSSRMENLSRGGLKPWADVLVVTCSACGMEKRFPCGVKKQPRSRDLDLISQKGEKEQAGNS